MSAVPGLGGAPARQALSGHPAQLSAAALRHSPVVVVSGLALVLLGINLALTPSMLGGHQLPDTFNLLVPSVLAAMASVPSVMSGRGGIDLSVGPLLGFVNVVVVAVLLPHALGGVWAALPIALGIGAGVGLANGAVIAYGRLQPVVVTLGSYLVLGGASLVVMPQPTGAEPQWIGYLSGAWLGGYLPRSVLLVLAGLAVWALLRWRGAIALILATGSEDRAAHTSGVRIGRVLCLAYAVGGLFAGLAGLALGVLIQSGDPNVGTQYTLPAVAAVALGGNVLGGGRGTLAGPILGAVSLFLIQTLLSGAHVSSLWIQVVYGGVLLAALAANSSLTSRLGARRALGVL